MSNKVTSRDFALKIDEMFRKRLKIELAFSMPNTTTIAEIDKMVEQAASVLHQCGWDAAKEYSHVENFYNTEYNKEKFQVPL